MRASRLRHTGVFCPVCCSDKYTGIMLGILYCANPESDECGAILVFKNGIPTEDAIAHLKMRGDKSPRLPLLSVLEVVRNAKELKVE